MTDSAALSPVPRGGRLALAALVMLAGLGIDLWTKAWAWDTLRTGETTVIVDGFAYFEFGFNTGSAFSLLRGVSWARVFFIGVTVAALGYMVRLALTLPTRWASGYVAVGLIASGALGNLHDRIFRTMTTFGETTHGVVDFIKIYYWPGKPWPTFNVADVALVLGVALLVLYMSRHGAAIDAAVAETKASPSPA
jgi:signal peptidase II